MSRHPRGVRHGSLGPPSAPPVLGLSCHGGESKGLSRESIQRVQGGHIGRPSIPHHLQFVSQRGPLPLVDVSRRGGRGNGWVQEGGREDGYIFLCRR